MFCKYCGKESKTEVCEECKKVHNENYNKQRKELLDNGNIELTADGKYILKEQNDSPFGYHIDLRKKILNNIIKCDIMVLPK